MPRKLPPPWLDESDPPPIDGPAVIEMVSRRLADLDSRWRRCDFAACRRARHCVAPGLPCSQKVRSPEPPMTAEEERAITEAMRASVKRRLAEIDAGACAPRPPWAPPRPLRRKKRR